MVNTRVDVLRSIVCLVICMCGLCGCSPSGRQRQESPANDAGPLAVLSLVSEVKATVPESAEIVDQEQVEAVKRIVKRAIHAGHQDRVAEALIRYREGSEGELWYEYMELAFADVWRRKDVPLDVRASIRSVESLREAAVRGQTRPARVAASIAIRGEYPKISEQVLLEEYARFVVDPWLSQGDNLSAGEALRDLGIFLPREITTVHEGKIILTRTARMRLNGIRVQRAVNLYNSRLRSLLDKERWDTLSKISKDPLQLMQECWEESQGPIPNDPDIWGRGEQPGPYSEDGSLWGSDPNAIHDVGDR